MSLNVKYRAALKKRVEFFASSLDAFLQDFTEKSCDGDKLGSIVAAARLAQLGMAIMDEYGDISAGLIESNTEFKASAQAAERVATMTEKNGDECYAMVHEVPPDGASPDRSLS